MSDLDVSLPVQGERASLVGLLERAHLLSAIASIAVATAACGPTDREPDTTEIGTVRERIISPDGTYSRIYQIYANDGQVLQMTSSGGLSAVPQGQGYPTFSTVFTPVAVSASDGTNMSDGDIFRMNDTLGRSIRHQTSWASLGAADSQSTWRLVRLNGSGQLHVGESFRFEATDDGKHMKEE